MGKKILIIEDDEYLGDALEKKLAIEGFEPVWVKDGGEGLKAFSEQKPDLVLLDILLPTMNGYEILEAQQKDENLRSIPVIIISNSGQPVEIDRAIALGVKDYLIKAQLYPEEVLAKIRPYFDGRTSSTDLGHPSRLAGKKVMLVEDDPTLGELLNMKLIHEGAATMYAKDGEEALGMLEKDLPEIVLLDLLLPGISGFDVLERMKAADRTKGVPVIVLSNFSQSTDIERIEKLGVSKHFVKAELTPDAIISEVRAVLHV